ncbi:WXG100 family type VII secretion target [Nocardia neocaledoniensis]|uniref:WXG100 family type VII secretion target n=1 Tax=Nocardia neocaledoniensis TaxID=236511 RepID=UPI002454C8EC|nr:WXG100 family type VII secretion target [Nocardia neocaledoniensis]
MSGEGELHVDVGELRSTAAFVAGQATAIRDRVKKLDDTIGKELLADGWQGKAASAYDESWLEWKAGAETVAAALTESADKLLEAANAYETQDQANAAATERLHGQLP